MYPRSSTTTTFARLGVLASSVAALAGLGLLAPAASSAAPAAAAPASTMPATIRAAHLSPDMPGVDIYITSFSGKTSSFLNNARYGAIGAYEQVPAGSYTFAIRPHGAAMTTAPLQTWSLTAQAGYAYTAAEVGTGTGHRGVVLSDNLTPPKAGYGNVRLIQAASRAGNAAEVVASDGPVVARGAAFGTSTKYAAVKAGTWTLKASGNGASAAKAVSIRAGSVTSVILLDAPAGGIRVIDSVDAAAAATAPTGSVDAGGGGLAAAVPSPAVDGDSVFGGLLVAAALGAVAVGGVALGGVAVRRRTVAARPS